MEDEKYGIDKESAHERAIALIPEDFFWNCTDQLSPFGSEEGDTSLVEFRDWRSANPVGPTIDCLKLVIEKEGDMNASDYNADLVSKEKIQKQISNPKFDAEQYIYVLDVSVIATGFAQLVDEGTIDADNKAIIQVAIDRQIMWSGLMQDWEYAEEYIRNLKVLDRVLKEA